MSEDYKPGERLRIEVSIAACNVGPTYRRNRRVTAFDNQGRELHWDSGRGWRVGFGTTISATVFGTTTIEDTRTGSSTRYTILRNVREV